MFKITPAVYHPTLDTYVSLVDFYHGVLKSTNTTFNIKDNSGVVGLFESDDGTPTDLLVDEATSIPAITTTFFAAQPNTIAVGTQKMDGDLDKLFNQLVKTIDRRRWALLMVCDGYSLTCTGNAHPAIAGLVTGPRKLPKTYKETREVLDTAPRLDNGCYVVCNDVAHKLPFGFLWDQPETFAVYAETFPLKNDLKK